MTLTLKQAESRFPLVKHVPVEWKMLDCNDDEAKGVIQAVFSTFDVMDSDGDIVLASAFTEGQEVAMVHAHDWSHIIGKGKVKLDPDRAIFDGQLFLDTINGMEAYKTIKAMGDLQEYSWGFRVLDYDIKEDPDAPWGYVRYIKSAELFEVSDVLKGAGVGTRTLTVKHRFDGDTVTEQVITPVAEPATGDQSKTDSQTGKTFNDELDDALAAVEGFVDRAKSLADTRIKEGRSVSSAKRNQLVGFAEDLEAQAKRLRDLSTEKSDESGDSDDGAVSIEVLKLLRTRQQREGFIPAD